MNQLYVIKIGGNVIDEPATFERFLRNFALLSGKKILVHGGGKVATRLGRKLGIEPQYIDGRRITDEQTIDLVTMVYGGLINKKAVALLQSFHCNAMGVTGADGNLIPATRRPAEPIDFGWVGDIDYDALNSRQWRILLDNGIVPVVAPLTHDQTGSMLNTNADTIAAAIAISLAKEYDTCLFYCFEKDGVLVDPDNASSALLQLDESTFGALKEKNVLTEGILPKLHNAFTAKNMGVSKVVIGNSEKIADMIAGGSGTLLI